MVKNFENKAETTQRVWEGYAERHAIAQASHPDSTKRYGNEKLSFIELIYCLNLRETALPRAKENISTRSTGRRRRRSSASL